MEDYTTTYDGYDVINSYTPGKTGLHVSKLWDDADNQDGLRPAEITVVLVKNGEETEEMLILSEENGWAGDFIDLDEYTDGVKNEYSVAELEAEGYESEIVQVEGTTTFIICNQHKPSTVDIEGSKTWDDDDDRYGFRPDYITIRLFADGEEITHVNVTEEDDWTWTFKDLPKYAKNGDEIHYSIDEEEVDCYEITEITDITEENGYKVKLTNEYTGKKRGNGSGGSGSGKSGSGTGSSGKGSSTSSVKASDNTPVEGMMVLMLASAMLMIGAIIYRRKRISRKERR